MADIKDEAEEVYKGHVGQDLVGARGPWGMLSREVMRSDWQLQTAFRAQD